MTERNELTYTDVRICIYDCICICIYISCIGRNQFSSWQLWGSFNGSGVSRINIVTYKARFKRPTFHVPNLMQMSKILCSSLFAFELGLIF